MVRGHAVVTLAIEIVDHMAAAHQQVETHAPAERRLEIGDGIEALVITLAELAGRAHAQALADAAVEGRVDGEAQTAHILGGLRRGDAVIGHQRRQPEPGVLGRCG
jgi:hypothetical protein